MQTADAAKADEKLIESKYLSSFHPRLMDWQAVSVFAKKNIRIALRYPANVLIWGFMPLLWFAPFVLMFNALAGSNSSANFTELAGFSDFIQFTIVGWFVYMWLDASIWSIGNNFRWEQFSGTLEPLFLTPVSRISILVGAALSDTVFISMQSMILLTLATIVFGVSYSMVAILPTIVILLMMVIALYGFSFMIGGLIMVFKDPSVLTQLVSQSAYTVSPVNYPLQALPLQVRFFAYFLPTTIAILTVREIAITGIFDISSFLLSFGSLALLAVVLWAVGLLSFRYAERWTKQRGSMGGF
jgi:ABC-2 type transport system permease protein